MTKAVIILSGGLDSSTCAYIAREKYNTLYTLSFNYGQKHTKELECAKEISEAVYAVEHRVIDLLVPKGTVLTSNEDVPKDRNLEEISKEIPKTYVPARNTLFIAYALQYAEEVGADAIYIGVTAIDYSGYPDCRPEYIEAWQNLINLATKKTVEGGQIKLETPLLHLYKAEIIQTGIELGVDYKKTWSCYTGDEKACGGCDSCKLRLKGFREAGQTDPIIYK